MLYLKNPTVTILKRRSIVCMQTVDVNCGQGTLIPIAHCNAVRQAMPRKPFSLSPASPHCGIESAGLDDNLKKALAEIGPVRHVVSPNYELSHPDRIALNFNCSEILFHLIAFCCSLAFWCSVEYRVTLQTKTLKPSLLYLLEIVDLCYLLSS